MKRLLFAALLAVTVGVVATVLHAQAASRLFATLSANLSTGTSTPVTCTVSGAGCFLDVVINGALADAQTFLFGPTATATTGGVLATSTTAVCTIADTNETTLFTYTLPAGSLNVNGRGVRVTAWGAFGATANNKVMRGYFGAEANLPGVTAASNGVSWMLTYSVLRSGASAEVGYGQLNANSGALAVQTRTPTDNTANAIVLKVTGQNAVAAANDICFAGAIVETIK